jgi:hypothetical protein
MKKKSAAAEAGAVDLLEEAVHLLRGAPAGLYAAYALGTLPFVLAFLYFWAAMSRGAYARDYADRAAVAMGLLFLWMKCWQTIFADGLRSRLTGRAGAPWTIRRAGLLALTQSALQPSALFAVPLALAIMLPFAWVFSFYQNLTILGGESAGLRDACRAASRQAATRPGQCHLLLGLLFVFALFVWLNVATTMAVLPHALKTLFGIDTAFTQAGWRSVLNTTYLACSFALTYIFVDPLIKAVFALRCFYGQSVQTGEDLKSELGRLRAAATPSLAVMVVLLLFSLQTPALAAPATPSSAEARPPTAVVSPAELDRSIDEVLKHDEFAWRMPRESAKDKPADRTNWFSRAIGAVVDLLKDIVKYCVEGVFNGLKWVGKMIIKLWPGANSSASGTSGWSSGWQSALQILLLLLIVGIASFLAILVIRLWNRRRKPEMVTAEALAAILDLNDENVAADQLPEDEWLKMARELMARGNFRVALRALYLAGLAHLAAREMIALALFKSNRDYEAELVRRARALPAVQNAFSQNVAVFDRVWYGLHEVTPEGLDQFQSNLEQIRAC